MSTIYPPDYDEADRAWLDSFAPAGGGNKMPDGAIVQGYILVVSYVNPETGAAEWFAHTPIDAPISQCLGLIEMAKFDMMFRNTKVRLSDDEDEGDSDEPS